jgi:hypothetical protein
MDQDMPEVDSARRALALAERSQRSARRPQPMPQWYGPVIGAMMALFWAGSDLGRALHAAWVAAVVGGGYCFGIGVAIGVVRDRQRVVVRFDRAYLLPTIAVVLGCLITSMAAYAAAWSAGIWARGTVAGVCGGLALWSGAVVLNHRVRADRAAFDAADVPS